MTIFTPPWGVLIDPATQAPAAGALVYFYATGTSTPVDTYADSAFGTPNDNPVECDSYGRLPSIFTKPALGQLKIVAKTSDGRTIFTRDPYDIGGSLDAPVTDSSGASKVYAAGDCGIIWRRTHSSAMTDTLPTAAAAGDGAWFHIRNTTSAYGNTVSVASAGTIDGSSSLVIYAGQERIIRSNGTTYYADPAPKYLGKVTISVPAAGWKKTTTNAAGDLTDNETTTNKIPYSTIGFVHTADKSAFTNLDLPLDYLAGSLEYRVRWSAAAGSAAQTIEWDMDAACFVDDQAMDGSFGSVAGVSDALLATGDHHVTAWTSIVPSNDAAGAFTSFRLTRDVSEGTLSQTAALIGVQFRYTTNKPTEA